MSQLSIVPHEAVDTYGDDFERHPVGSGAFFVKVLSRRGDMVLEKNSRYWGTYPSDGEAGDEAAGLLKDAGKKLPFVDEVHLPLIEEAQPRILSFQKGKLDLVGIDKNNFSNFLTDDNGRIVLKEQWKNRIQAYAVPGLSTEYFKFNMKDALVGGYSKEKIALRQAGQCRSKPSCRSPLPAANAILI